MINLRDIELDKKYIGNDKNENNWVNAQNSIIKKIFETIKTTNNYYVEFGYRFYLDTTDSLRLDDNWTGTSFGLAGKNEPQINYFNQYLGIKNILDVFKKYNIPKEFDFICIDTDWCDWYLLYQILKKYNPRCIMIEINNLFNYDEDRIILYEDCSTDNIGRPSNRSIYQGCSLKSLVNLCKNYTLIYVNADKSDAFFIRNDIPEKKNFINHGMNEKIYNLLPGCGINNNYFYLNNFYKYDKLSKKFKLLYEKYRKKNTLSRNSKRIHDKLNRPFISSNIILNNKKILITDLIYLDNYFNELQFDNLDEKENYVRKHPQFENTIKLINNLNNIINN